VSLLYHRDFLTLLFFFFFFTTPFTQLPHSKRLLALAAQKFISDIATDAFQYCKVRQQSQKRAAPGKVRNTAGMTGSRSRCTMNAKCPQSVYHAWIDRWYFALVQQPIGEEDGSYNGRPFRCAWRIRHQREKARLLPVDLSSNISRSFAEWRSL